MVTFHSIVTDGHVPLFITCIHCYCEQPILFVRSFQKIFYFVRSQKYCSFFIYFVRFFTEQSISKIIRSNKRQFFFEKIIKKLSFLKSLFQKIVRSVKKLTFFQILWEIRFLQQKNYLFFQVPSNDFKSISIHGSGQQ